MIIKNNKLMKKIFTTIAMAVVAVAAQAQIVFLDPEGKEYTDGQTMTINSTIDPDWGDVVLEAPDLKNTSTSGANVYLNVDIKTLPANTAVQECFATNCYFFDLEGAHDTQSVFIAAGATRSTATEWQCYNFETDDYSYGVCTVVLTAYVNGEKSCAVTVNYVNADPAGISTVEKNATVVNQYDVQGRMVANHKGLIIKKMSDGTVRKELVK